MSTLGMSGHTLQKGSIVSIYQFIENCDVHLRNKSTSFLPSFLRYCKDNYKLAILTTLACLAMTSKNDTTTLCKTLMFVIMQKNIFIPHLFFEILKRYCRLTILGTLGTPGHPHQLRKQ